MSDRHDDQGPPPAGGRPLAVLLNGLQQGLTVRGLTLRGGFALTPEDRLGPGTLLLIGSVGAALWPVFQAERREEPDPLDRWTRRVIDPLADRLGARALYPFQGPPYWPFQHWAQRALGLTDSPLRLLMDPVYGPWHALRAALILPPPVFSLPVTALPASSPSAGASPCLTCADPPCLRICPAAAVQPGGYDPAACAGEITAADRAGCLENGCAARNACPVGAAHRYPSAQQVLHLRSFLSLYQS